MVFIQYNLIMLSPGGRSQHRLRLEENRLSPDLRRDLHCLAVTVFNGPHYHLRLVRKRIDFDEVVPCYRTLHIFETRVTVAPSDNPEPFSRNHQRTVVRSLNVNDVHACPVAVEGSCERLHVD